MKTSRLRSAFTLIELITVISIIAILMALLLPQIAGAKEATRRQAAAAAVRDICNACRNYYNDYGKFPPVEDAKNQSGGTGANANTYMSFGDKPNGKCKVENNVLFDILRAISRGENQNNIYNKRQQKYISLNKAVDKKNPRDGFVDGSEFPAAMAGQLMDPWGTQYCVVLDVDGNEEIDMGSFFQDLSGANNVVRFSAVAFALGKNGKIGGKDYEGSLRKPDSSEAPDDIISWQ